MSTQSTAPESTSLPHLPDEIWYMILQYLLQAVPLDVSGGSIGVGGRMQPWYCSRMDGEGAYEAMYQPSWLMLLSPQVLQVCKKFNIFGREILHSNTCIVRFCYSRINGLMGVKIANWCAFNSFDEDLAVRFFRDHGDLAKRCRELRIHLDVHLRNRVLGRREAINVIRGLAEFTRDLRAHTTDKKIVLNIDHNHTWQSHIRNFGAPTQFELLGPFRNVRCKNARIVGMATPTPAFARWTLQLKRDMESQDQPKDLVGMYERLQSLLTLQRRPYHIIFDTALEEEIMSIDDAFVRYDAVAFARRSHRLFRLLQSPLVLRLKELINARQVWGYHATVTRIILKRTGLDIDVTLFNSAGGPA